MLDRDVLPGLLCLSQTKYCPEELPASITEARPTTTVIFYVHPSIVISPFGRRVKVLPLNSPYFSITKKKGKGKEDESGKVAPGMEVQYKITFSPKTKDDCGVDLIVATEREKYLVPIRALGIRCSDILMLLISNTKSHETLRERCNTSPTFFTRSPRPSHMHPNQLVIGI
eukprot:618043-Prorocentrum_minimum.AAC.3